MPHLREVLRFSAIFTTWPLTSPCEMRQNLPPKVRFWGDAPNPNLIMGAASVDFGESVSLVGGVNKRLLIFPRISSFFFVGFFWVPLFSTNQAKRIIVSWGPNSSLVMSTTSLTSPFANSSCSFGNGKCGLLQYAQGSVCKLVRNQPFKP